MWRNGSKTSWTRWIPPVIFCSLLASCGKEGDPHPPLPRIPKPVTAAVQQVGDVLELRMDWPSAFVDGAPMPDWKGLEAYRLSLPAVEDKIPPPPQETTFYTRRNLLSIMSQETLEGKKADGRLVLRTTASDLGLPVEKASAVFWGFIVVGPQGQRGEPSPPVPFLFEPPLASVSGLEAVSAPGGVRLAFMAPERADKIRVARSVEAGLPAVLAELPAATGAYLDATVRPGGFYTYILTALGAAEGHLSAPASVQITYTDTFPPAPPGNVIYLPLDGSARIKFSTGEGASRYTIHRRCPNEDWAPVGETRDTFLEVPASLCDYGVAAVDVAGNTSPIIPAKREEP